MSTLGYLFAAYAIVWLALLAYLGFVASNISSLRRDVQALRDMLGADEPAPGGARTSWNDRGVPEHEGVYR